MKRRSLRIWRMIVMGTVLLCAVGGRESCLWAQHDHKHHDDDDKKKISPPRIFLDKSPRIVQYQLKRLDNERLLVVERRTDDPKYAPVYTAILIRAGMSPQHREDALKGLVTLRKSSSIAELLAALSALDPEDRQQERTFRQLALMALRQPATTLAEQSRLLAKTTGSDHVMLRSLGYAGLNVAGKSADAWSLAKAKASSTSDWLASIALLPKPSQRSARRDTIVELIATSDSATVRRDAIHALSFVPSEPGDTFRRAAPFVAQAKLRTTAIRTLLTVPQKHRDPGVSAKLTQLLVRHAEATPAAERTTDEFVDAMQLTDQLLARIPVKDARAYRARLREITVRVVRIHTVEEEMRYDTPFFAVEAGRPVQIVLQNEDLMPHNLVVTVPGALKEVAMAGAVLGPSPGFEGKAFVPKSDKVLFATKLVPAHTTQRLTFTAPSEPGEYPFVCTFPRHWMRMYGVMVVVKDLDAWAKNPVKPKDPIGSNRSFVKKWTMDDLQDELASGLRARSMEIGQRIFTEASCAQCHKVAGKGGAVGPELTEVFKRWKGDRRAVLREILEPSHRIDAKYAVRQILTDGGRVISGIVLDEDKDMIRIVDNPESPKPIVVKKDEIDQMVKTSKSMMPKALLDQFTKDEIFELLAFLERLNPNGK